MNLRQRIEDFVKDLRGGPHYCDLSYRRDSYTANRLDELLDEAPDEDWQPLTSDTVLPESGYLVLWDACGEMAVAQRIAGDWALYEDGQVIPMPDAAVMSANGFTHYRVLRGPEGL